MIPGTPLRDVARLAGGALEGPPSAAEVACAPGAISIDSRTCEPGQLFVAVHGERDGHDFVGAAAEKGAIGALVEPDAVVRAPGDFPLIRVDDPVAALQRWAAAHRAASGVCLIAVTGSSGKTTTKDRLAAMLSKIGPTHATPGNLNNHLGVPIALLGLRPEHRWAVIEIAMNHPGEIAPLSRLARPDHAVLTTIGWAHIGAFGSREAILHEKLSILAGLSSDGILFHDADPWILDHLPRDVSRMRRRTFGLVPEADAHPDSIEWEVAGTRFASTRTGEVLYPCPGLGPLMAALAASLVAESVGVPKQAIRASLEEARPRPLRMEPRPLGPATALLDCYNASPESSLAAIEFLLSIRLRGRRWLAFGEMRELGDRSGEQHARIGERAAALDGAFFLGGDCAPALDAYRRAAPEGAAAIYTSVDDLAKDLCVVLGPGDVVLFKGARLMAMERAFDACAELLRAPREG